MRNYTSVTIIFLLATILLIPNNAFSQSSSNQIKPIIDIADDIVDIIKGIQNIKEHQIRRGRGRGGDDDDDGYNGGGGYGDDDDGYNGGGGYGDDDDGYNGGDDDDGYNGGGDDDDDYGGGDDDDDGNDIPLDGGLSFLAIAGAGLGIKKVIEHRNKS